MKNDPKILVEKLLNGCRLSLARVLSLIESGSDKSVQCAKLLYPHSGKAKIVGVTGSPGAGKSTLVEKLVISLRGRGLTVAVLAVDPSSPFSGGALLGDRIRMADIVEDTGVFIRSMATRGALGGLAPKTSESVFALDAAGFDIIIIETVGVGQAEVEIVRTADTVVLVLVPGMGDGVQALKAGIVEIADIYAVNKADISGVERLMRELKTMLSLGPGSDWEAPIQKVIATEGEGVGDLVDSIFSHQTWATNSGIASERKKQFLKAALDSHLSKVLLDSALAAGEKDGTLDELLTEVYSRNISPTEAVDTLVKLLGKTLTEKSP